MEETDPTTSGREMVSGLDWRPRSRDGAGWQQSEAAVTSAWPLVVVVEVLGGGGWCGGEQLLQLVRQRAACARRMADSTSWI